MSNEDAPGEGGGWEGDVAEGAGGAGAPVMPIDHGDAVDAQESHVVAPGANVAGGVSNAIRDSYTNLANAVESGLVSEVDTYVYNLNHDALSEALSAVGGIPNAVVG